MSSRGWRLFLELALLGLLFWLDGVSGELFVFVTAAVLVVGPAASWTVAGILLWTSRQAPEVVSLRERADDAVTLALASSGFAVAGSVVFARLFGILVPGRPIVILLGYGALLVLVPAFAWLRTWRNVWMPYIRRQKEER